MADLTATLFNVQQELIEFKLQAQEYEEELENEIKYKDAQISLALTENDELKEINKDLNKRLKQASVEIDTMMKENEKLKKTIKDLLDEKRRLEDLNDYWENSARILEHSRLAIEEKLVEASENAILYKEELEVVALKKQEEIQRLKDEFNDIKTDIEIKKGGKLKIQMTGKILIDSPSNSKLKKPSNPLPNLKGCIKFYLDIRTSPVPDLTQLSSSTLTLTINKKDCKTFEFSEIFEKTQPSFPTIFKNLKSNRSICIIHHSSSPSSSTLFTILKQLLFDFQLFLSPETQVQIYQQNILASESKSLKLNQNLQSFNSVPVSNLNKENIDLIIETYIENLNQKKKSSHLVTTVQVKDLNICIQFAEIGSFGPGDDIKESLFLNKALSTLEATLAAIKGNQKYVPVRNSSLTTSLSMTLTQSSQIYFILQTSCEQSVQDLNSFLSITSRINFFNPLGYKNMKNVELARVVNVVNNDFREKQQLLITVDRLEKDLKVYKEFYSKNNENKAKLVSTPMSNCKSCKTSPRHSNARIPSSRLLFSPFNF